MRLVDLYFNLNYTLTLVEISISHQPAPGLVVNSIYTVNLNFINNTKQTKLELGTTQAQLVFLFP